VVLLVDEVKGGWRRGPDRRWRGTGCAAIAIRLATLPDDGPTGGFFEDDGVVPW
jgi:hypothetical protein